MTKDILEKLMLRFPRLSFGVDDTGLYSSDQTEQLVIVTDAYATPAKDRQIERFVDKIMARDYPGVRYEITKPLF